MKHHQVAFRRFRKIKVILVPETLLDFGILRVSVQEMLRRVVLDLVIDFNHFRSALNSAARVQEK